MRPEFIRFFVPLVSLFIVVAAVYAVTVWKRRDAAVDTGIGSVRRLYFYFVSFVALMMAANGLVLIVQFVLEGLFGGDVLSPSRTRVAAGASLAIVGTPLWAVHWIFVQRYVRDLPVERRSLIRKFYVYLVLGMAVALVVGASTDLLQWALRTGSFSGYGWGAVLVWTVVWVFHWRTEDVEGQPTAETRTMRRIYTYLVSGATVTVQS